MNDKRNLMLLVEEWIDRQQIRSWWHNRASCVQTTQDGIIGCKGEMQVMMNTPSHDHSAINVSVFNDWFISKDEMYARRRRRALD